MLYLEKNKLYQPLWMYWKENKNKNNFLFELSPKSWTVYKENYFFYLNEKIGLIIVPVVRYIT